MTIAELGERGKALVRDLPRDILLVALFILSASASFGLGVLAGRDSLKTGVGEGVLLTELPLTASPLGATKQAPEPATLPAGGQVVASKNGTKYFLPWCGGASLIKDENKIWFADAAAAKKAGYEPAANCKGL